MTQSLGVRFGLAIFFLLWVPLMAAAGSGAYWLWIGMGSGPSSGLQSLALRSDTLKLEEAAARLSRNIDAFLLERITEVRSWAASPVVLQAARNARAAHVKEGFDNLNLRQLETKFRTRKSLGLAPEARGFLGEQIRRSPNYGGVFFTDAMGFNVALSGPATDFVQSDEDWWKQAWASGFYVGDIVFNSSTHVWAMDIAVAMRDPGSGEPVGVMKAVVPLRFVQLFSDRVARRLSAPGQLLHVRLSGPALNGAEAAQRTEFAVVTRDGLLLAETRTSHDRGRIMQPDVNVLTEASLAHLTPTYEGGRAGSFIAARTNAPDPSEGAPSQLVAFARSADTPYFAPVIDGFSGFNWMVIAEAPNLSNHTALPELDGSPAAEQPNLGQQLLLLGATLCGALLLSSLLLCWVFSRWVLSPVRALTDRIQRMEQGHVSARVTVAGTGEFAELASALDRIRNMIVKMAERLQQNAAGRASREAGATTPPGRS